MLQKLLTRVMGVIGVVALCMRLANVDSNKQFLTLTTQITVVTSRLVPS